MTQTDQERPEAQSEEQKQDSPQQQLQPTSPTSPTSQGDDKSLDKKEIHDEEREKMLNAENSKHQGEAPKELEVNERKPKRKIPIGGIKMPGFCRSKSKEPVKDDETKVTIEGDGEAPSKDAEAAGGGDKPAGGATPGGKDAKEKEARRGVGGGGGRLLEAIRVPLNNVISRMRRQQESGDTELATAGLASAETLEDGEKEKNAEAAAATVGEDGMETVRLDAEAADGGPPAKPSPFISFMMFARRNVWITAAVLAILLAVIVIICVACVGPRRAYAQPVRDGKVTAQTQCGLVEGLEEEDAYVFRGIPYAVPPLNERRWTPAESLVSLNNCWNGTHRAYNSSNVCWQRNGTETYGSEDCLYLDIYTPQVYYEKPLAVVVMIGADTLSGPSPGVMIPSGYLARVDEIVYVSVNFRLDVLGFLAAEPLSHSAHPPTSGNYALSDIITALQWVRNNIQHFGGDKDKVTLWGHRAGGTLVTALIGSRKAQGLFQRAWVSSGSAIFPSQELKISEEQSRDYLDAVGCADANISCLRNKSVHDLLSAVPKAWYAVNDGVPHLNEAKAKKHEWLVKDGVIIQQHIGEVFSKKTLLPVKVVLGTTAQSGSLPAHLNYNSTVSEKEIRNIVNQSPIVVEEKVDPFNNYNATLKDLHTLISDIRVVCPLMTVATMSSEVPFYVSTFARDGIAADVDNDARAILGFFPNRTTEQKRHLPAIQSLFKHFVYHGEVKEAEHGKILIVDQDVLPRAGYENCKLWIDKSIVPRYGRID